MKHARDMTAPEFASATRTIRQGAIVRMVGDGDRRKLEDLRRRHPDLAAAADAIALEAHRDLERGLTSAKLALLETNEVKRDTSTPLLRARAAEAVSKAEAVQDAALLAVEASHNALMENFT